MKTSDLSTLACRHCRYYTPEGRRGGHCQQLSATVQGAWKACALVIPPFTPTWETVEGIMRWQQKNLASEESIKPACAQATELLEPSETCFGSRSRY